MNQERIYQAGNALAEGDLYRGWFIGTFRQDAPNDIRATQDVEIKWGVHNAGDHRPNWASNATATSLCILIKGVFTIKLPEATFTLSNEGDYLIWGPTIPHTWIAETETVTLTIRWPSAPNCVEEIVNRY